MKAPAGTTLIEVLGTGTLFEVALVRRDDMGAPDPLRSPGHDAAALAVCKRPAPTPLRAPAGRAALVREAKSLAALGHPAVPRLLRVGQDEQGHFLLEERVEGRSLREVAAAWRERGILGQLARHLAEQAFSALADLHDAGGPDGPLAWSHGDIGPDHVWMGPHGEVRFVDFGASRLRGLDASLFGDDRGTLPFVAPEVARGEVAPDQGNDVYALAATVLFLLIGERLARARTEAALLAEVGSGGLHLEALGEVGCLSGAQKDILRAALGARQGDRLSDARALAAAFGA